MNLSGRQMRRKILEVALAKTSAVQQAAVTAMQKADNGERAMLVFMQLGVVERFGWLLFGHTWLVKRIHKTHPAKELTSD
jgi:hypothetical protein